MDFCSYFLLLKKIVWCQWCVIYTFHFNHMGTEWTPCLFEFLFDDHHYTLNKMKACLDNLQSAGFQYLCRQEVKSMFKEGFNFTIKPPETSLNAGNPSLARGKRTGWIKVDKSGQTGPVCKHRVSHVLSQELLCQVQQPPHPNIFRNRFQTYELGECGV